MIYTILRDASYREVLDEFRTRLVVHWDERREYYVCNSFGMNLWIAMYSKADTNMVGYIFNIWRLINNVHRITTFDRRVLFALTTKIDPVKYLAMGRPKLECNG
jgi:hypothetical protein